MEKSFTCLNATNLCLHFGSFLLLTMLLSRCCFLTWSRLLGLKEGRLLKFAEADNSFSKHFVKDFFSYLV